MVLARYGQDIGLIDQSVSIGYRPCSIVESVRVDGESQKAYSIVPQVDTP